MAVPARVQGDEIALTFRGPRGLRAVRLRSELVKRGEPPEFRRRGRSLTWDLLLPRPLGVDRVEYLLELVDAAGESELVRDPANPLVAPGPFGDKSVLELPGYSAPVWLDGDAEAGTIEPLRLRSRLLRTEVEGLLWTSHGADEAKALPLLVVHDGPEYAEYSGLLRLLESCTAELELPPLRAALLAPPRPRDEHYSASAAYARALALDVIPALERAAPRPRPEGRETRVGMGASLGALAMLHAHRLHAATFAGLFLQSGSFFRLRSDRQESGLPRFRRIARFVGSVLRATDWPDPIPVALTCGAGEENLANNRAVREALARQGYPAELHEHPDAHNWTAWRDSFHPPLVSLLQRLWG
jgi:enterochelin esterase-like enzyme